MGHVIGLPQGAVLQSMERTSDMPFCTQGGVYLPQAAKYTLERPLVLFYPYNPVTLRLMMSSKKINDLRPGELLRSRRHMESNICAKKDQQDL
jgi:hypothetical protein